MRVPIYLSGPSLFLAIYTRMEKTDFGFISAFVQVLQDGSAADVVGSDLGS